MDRSMAERARGSRGQFPLFAFNQDGTAGAVRLDAGGFGLGCCMLKHLCGLFHHTRLGVSTGRVAPGAAVRMAQGHRGTLLLLVEFGGFGYDGRWFGGARVHILEERSGRGRRSVQSLLLQLVVLRFGVACRAIGALHNTPTPAAGRRWRKRSIHSKIDRVTGWEVTGLNLEVSRLAIQEQRRRSFDTNAS